MSRRSEQAAAQGITVLYSSGDNGDVASITGLAQGRLARHEPVRDRGRRHEPRATERHPCQGRMGLGHLHQRALERAGLAERHGRDRQRMVAVATGVPLGHGIGSASSSRNRAGLPGRSGTDDGSATTTTTADGQTITFPKPHRVIPDGSLVGDPSTGVVVGEAFQVGG